MKLIKISVFIAFLCFSLFCPQIIKAQPAVQKTGIFRKYSKGIIYKKDRKRFNGKNLIFSSQTLSFQDQYTTQQESIPLSEIEYVRARVGTHAVEGALVGGGLFLLSAIAAVADVEADPYTEVENAGEVIAITTAIGFGCGLLIGALFPKEKTVFKRGRFLVKRSNPSHIKTVRSGRSFPLLTLNVTF